MRYFESDNGIAAGDDVLVLVSGVTNPAVTGVDGTYSFSGLAAGTYFVEQQAPPTGMAALNDVVEVEITDAGARGTTSLLIDDFAAPSPAQESQATNGNPASSSVSGRNALGGTRDLFVEVAGVGTTATVDLRANQISGFADLVSAFGTSGQGTITYDGDSDPLNLPASGVDVLDDFLVNLPAGFQLDTAVGSNGSTFDSTTGIWTIGTIPRGSSRTLTVTLTVDSSAAASVVQNTASV